MLVLDEADRMLDAGFVESMESIFSYAPEKKQSMFFSATFPPGVKELARKYMISPETVTVDLKHEEGLVAHHFFRTAQDERPSLLSSLLCAQKPESAIVFCNTKVQCDEVADYLARNGFSAFCIHGDIEQRERTEVMIRLANRSLLILVATDVAARGIDIKDLEAVINYDLPFEAEVYVHRSGRTARAGKSGKVFSFLCPGEDFRLAAINTLMSENFTSREFTYSNEEDNRPAQAPMVTFSINGGRRSKISPGHILGALTGEDGLKADKVGRIDCLDLYSYIAIKADAAAKAEELLRNRRIKGKKFTLRRHS